MCLRFESVLGTMSEALPGIAAKERHTLAGLDTATMIDLLSNGKCQNDTIDVASFEECFGRQTKGEEGVGECFVELEDRSKRRETADPSKLRELLESYHLEKDTKEEPVGRANSRRVSLDPALLTRKGGDTMKERRATMVLQSVPEEEEETSSRCTTTGRPSMTWSFDETRQTMEELRRQLQVERDVATDAEHERDDLAKEVAALQHEMAARIELIRSLEEQRDAATVRANAAEARATRAVDAEAAAKAIAQASIAEARTVGAKVNELEAANQALDQRVQTLNKVKITKDFAARVRALADERDALRDRLYDKENHKPQKRLAYESHETSASAKQGDECRQS